MLKGYWAITQVQHKMYHSNHVLVRILVTLSALILLVFTMIFEGHVHVIGLSQNTWRQVRGSSHPSWAMVQEAEVHACPQCGGAWRGQQDTDTARLRDWQWQLHDWAVCVPTMVTSRSLLGDQPPR